MNRERSYVRSQYIWQRDARNKDVIHRVVGVGTDWMARLKAGDEVFILGPLGNQFQLPPAEGQATIRSQTVLHSLARGSAHVVDHAGHRLFVPAYASA